MNLKLFSSFCILQSMYHSNDARIIIFPPDIHAKNGRIIVGTPAPDGIAPYQCSVQVMAANMKPYHTCGCAIIDDRWVVTAGHCVDGLNPYLATIVVGTNDLSNGGRRYSVRQVIGHESYDQPDNANDIGLIEVEEPIEFDEKVQPIELETKDIPCTRGLLLTGWGMIDSTDATPNRLQMIKLNAISSKRCNQMWLHEPEVFRSQICTHSKIGEGACMGDSGGPLVFNNKLVGIVRFGMPCAHGMPDVFTKVSSFL